MNGDVFDFREPLLQGLLEQSGNRLSRGRRGANKARDVRGDLSRELRSLAHALKLWTNELGNYPWGNSRTLLSSISGQLRRIGTLAQSKYSACWAYLPAETKGGEHNA